MKKILMLLFFVMFLTGCSTEVNIIINDTGINETISIIDDNTNYYNNVPVFYDDIFSEIEPDVRNEGVNYYNKNVTHGTNGYKINYNYKFTLDEYKRARSIKNAFQSFNIIKNTADGELTISTDSSGLKYFNTYSNLNDVKININPSYKVKDSNADYVNGNVYTWLYNKHTKKHIYMVLEIPKDESNVNSNPNNSDNSNNEESSTDTNKNDETNKDIVDDKTEENVVKKDKKESFLDKYPYVVLFGCIVVFVMFLIILLKIVKTD